MASLNLSIYGPSIKNSYQGVLNSPASASASPTYGYWALFSVQAPLLSAFQESGAKESILKVERTGEGELADLVEEFNEGRIQFAFVKVKNPNTGLPKYVLIAWCGGGVPERTKGYFTSHSAAVAKILHGYHVQVTARSDSDLNPESIVQKVSDASGAKYSAGLERPAQVSSSAPPVAKTPVFSPSASRSAGAFNPLKAAQNEIQNDVDDDGWGPDAPPVTRTQLEKVTPAYKPTKVNMSELLKNADESRTTEGFKPDNGSQDVVKGGYQPVGKVDIAALRAQVKKAGDDRPTVVRGAYEPVGKVDIAAIRARAQRPSEVAEENSSQTAVLRKLPGHDTPFVQSDRLTELPKPKVAKKFGAASVFIGTKAPTPDTLGLGAPSIPKAAPVGAASRTFADQNGKTPAQIWAEKKAKQQLSNAAFSPPAMPPVTAQKSGSEWRSGYSGKSWAPVQTTNLGRGGAGAVESQQTGGTERSEAEAPLSPAGGINALRDRFKDAPPMGGAATPSTSRRVYVPATDDSEQAPSPPHQTSQSSGDFALPGLLSRPATEEDEAQDEVPPYSAAVAVPVPRGPEAHLKAPTQRLPPRPVPASEDLPTAKELSDQEEAYDPRTAAASVHELSYGHVADAHALSCGGKRALIQYDYEKAEDNEIELREGEHVTNIEMVDEDWWMGTNAQGESGLFPSNYVELVEDDGSALAPPVATPAASSVIQTRAAAAQPQPPASEAGRTATAVYDYEAAEDNELSFPEGAKITQVEFPDDDWWFGHHMGTSGLFPANYVELDA